jgi:hypothetical protein
VGSRDGLPRLLRHFGATTLSFLSARRRNSFRSSLRLNGTSDIGIASWKLVAADQQVWYPRLSASRRQGNRLRAYLYELETINRTCLRRPQRQAMQPLTSRRQPNHPHLTQRTMTLPTSKLKRLNACEHKTKTSHRFPRHQPILITHRLKT